MSAILNILETDRSINRNGGFVWNRLHSERENICEAMLQEWQPGARNGPEGELRTEDMKRTELWHCELLQARLRKIDDALDRLMSGSYGNCSKCGRWIEDPKLHFDPAIAFCPDCWRGMQNASQSNRSSGEKIPQGALLEHLVEINPSVEGVAIESLAPFDTIYVRTMNSEYRIFLLDPQTGRAIIEGGSHFVEPVEVMLNGSSFGGSTFKIGWIGVGLRLEFRTNGKLASTSPVQSFHVESQVPGESTSGLASVP